MTKDTIGLNFVSTLSLSLQSRVSKYAVNRLAVAAVLRRIAVGILIAFGPFVATSVMAANTYSVNSLADTAGACEQGWCPTLRSAINAANASSGNTITFAATSGTITLTSDLPAITQNMTITGPGAGTLTISGSNAFQIFYINTPSATATISGLTLVNAKPPRSGSAIANLGTLTVKDSVISNSSSIIYPGGSDGVALFNSGTLTIINCVFSENTTGGAIMNWGTLTTLNSTFTGNSVTGGGAIANYGTLAVTNSTFNGNYATLVGGGAIYNLGALTVTNSTFTGNFVTQGGPRAPGGAIYSGDGVGGSLTVINSTFSGNSSTNSGGAIFNQNFAKMTLENNIFVGNTTVGAGAAIFTNGAPVSAGPANASYNLYYQNLNMTGGTAFEDDCNDCTSNTNAISGSDPNLLPLGYYGGPTETMLPRFGSPAICAGIYADVPNGVTTDQRGFPLNNSSCGNGGVDLGAVQSDYFPVTTTLDSGDGSLRAAITAANAAGGDIAFASGVSGTITLLGLLPTISQSMTIVGPGAANLTISGNHTFPIFNMSSVYFTISGLTLANGSNSSGAGGAISNITGILTVTSSVFSGNSSAFSQGGDGGAISNYAGTLTVTDCAFSGNSAGSLATGTGAGGAIDSGGTLTVNSSTFSGNSAGFGGAILAAGVAHTVTNSTFSGNSASPYYGGAILSSSGTMTVTNSTFSGNSAIAGAEGGAIFNYNGAILVAENNIFSGNSAGSNGGAGIMGWLPYTTIANHNLFYRNLDASTTEDDCNSCTSNTNAITGSDPLLAALGNYGGLTQTLLPAPGSPAICGGSTALIPTGVTTDQRGFSRTTTYGSGSCLDLGAVQTNYTAVAFSSPSYNGGTGQPVSPAPVVTVTENSQNIGGVPITLGYSGTASPTGLGPVTTVGGTGATFSSLTASAAAQGTLSVSLPITASGNSVQPAALTASATLSVLSTTQTITFAVASPMTYGTAPITLTATGGASGNPVIFSLDPTSTPGAAALSGSTLTINSVGTIVIDANQAASAGFTAATQVQHSIVVNPAPMTITASSPTVTYGSAVPTITPIFGTFYNGDTSAVLTKQPTCVTAYTITSAVGSSPSTSCSAAAAANYAFSYVNGAVTVNSAPAFVITGSSPSLTITRGTTTGNTVPITITPANGFTGTVTLTCTITPAATSNPPTCSLSPSSVTLTGAGAQSSTLTISTTAAVAENQIKKLLWPSSGTVLAVVLMIGLPRRRGNWLVMLSVLALSIALGTIGCGGGSGSAGSSGNPGTTAGTYTVAVTGTSGSFTGTVGTVTLTVQ